MSKRRSKPLSAPAPQAVRRWFGAALLGMGCLSGFSAQALNLGRLEVLSALGESLRVEVEVLDFKPEDADSFKASVVGTGGAKGAETEARAGMGDLRMTLQRLADGRVTLTLAGTRPVTEPFVELGLEISWAAGKLTRNYTLLFMPAQGAEAVTPLVPALQVAPLAAALPLPAASIPAAAPVAAPPASPPPLAASPAAAVKRVTVKRGDTASQLALQAKALNVSLDQMLLAMLRSNPDAFVANNVNRLVAGAELALPSADQALALDAAEARQSVTLQSQDFNAFRQQLANNAKTADVSPASRAASGKLKSAVEEKTPTAAASDKLTLSKGALQSGASPEEKLSQQRKAKDADERLAELSKNIRDLSDLDKRSAEPAASGGSTSPGDQAQTAAESALPAVALPTPPTAPLSQAEDAPNLIDRLAQNDAVLPAAGGLLSVLLAWILVRSRRNKAAQASLLVTGTDNPNDPSDTHAHGPAFVPMTDQALISGVDRSATPPADYELPRMKPDQTPDRMDMLIELMDLCVARQDRTGFEALAIRALSVAGGPGKEWPEICRKGQSLDPSNPLYAPAEVAPQPSPFANLDFDLELNARRGQADASANDAPTEPTLNRASQTPQTPSASSAKVAKVAKTADPSGEFDMASISLDFKAPPAESSDNPPRNAP